MVVFFCGDMNSRHGRISIGEKVWLVNRLAETVRFLPDTGEITNVMLVETESPYPKQWTRKMI